MKKEKALKDILDGTFFLSVNESCDDVIVSFLILVSVLQT